VEFSKYFNMELKSKITHSTKPVDHKLKQQLA